MEMQANLTVLQWKKDLRGEGPTCLETNPRINPREEDQACLPACPQGTGQSSLVKGILGWKAREGRSGQGVGATVSKCRQYHTSRQVLHFLTCPAFQDTLKGQNESAYNLGPGGSFKSKDITPVLRAHGMIISHRLGPGRLSRSQSGSSGWRSPAAHPNYVVPGR